MQNNQNNIKPSEKPETAEDEHLDTDRGFQPKFNEKLTIHSNRHSRA